MVQHEDCFVLRSGGDYNASDVQWLVNQLQKAMKLFA